MENSKIEWTTHTFNPWKGCTKVSPGCAHCYAEALMDIRFGQVKWGKGQPRKRTSPAYWQKPLQWNRDARGAAERPRVFCASLADWLDDEVPASWLFDLITLIHKTPNLDWLLLTKRPQNFRKRLKAAAAQCTVDPLDITDRIYAWIEGSRGYSNVWIGTSVEDQIRAEERIPSLLSIPARIRFLSCEPLLGPVDLVNMNSGFNLVWDRCIEWIICGGESGPNARPMEAEWARSLRDQCEASGVAFFFKQWGGVDKKATGRELDGRIWDELPGVLPRRVRSFDAPDPEEHEKLLTEDTEDIDEYPDCGLPRHTRLQLLKGAILPTTAAMVEFIEQARPTKPTP